MVIQIPADEKRFVKKTPSWRKLNFIYKKPELVKTHQLFHVITKGKLPNDQLSVMEKQIDNP